MEDISNGKKNSKKKSRPAQRLYIPPAQRNKKKPAKAKSISESNTTKDDSSCDDNNTAANRLSVETLNLSDDTETIPNSQENGSTNNDGQSIVILLDNNNKSDVDKEEMERAIVNINRKSRPLIKHVNVGNKDVLHIDIDDVKLNKTTNKPNRSRATSKNEQVANWEDLFNEDDESCGENAKQITDYIGNDVSKQEYSSEDEEYYPKKNTGLHDLDHVIELYDFPSTFKTQDLMQLYSEVNNELMYTKWCDETHALLVLSTPNHAKRALNIQHGIIKSRTMADASNIALQVASKADLKPAMKRPQTNMQTARRLITNHLGTKSKLSKEDNAREREELQKAKELKRALKQSENDAWAGNPRPSTA